MKPLIRWTGMAVLLMIGCPWLAVTFAGSAGMAVCFLLFFAVNPCFCALCGIAAGRDLKSLWPAPILSALLFLAGTWIFFDPGEFAFLLYCGIYLIIGIAFMAITSAVRNRKKKHTS